MISRWYTQFTIEFEFWHPISSFSAWLSELLYPISKPFRLQCSRKGERRKEGRGLGRKWGMDAEEVCFLTSHFWSLFACRPLKCKLKVCFFFLKVPVLIHYFWAPLLHMLFLWLHSDNDLKKIKNKSTDMWWEGWDFGVKKKY